MLTRIAVVGASGFVGRAVVDAFRAEDGWAILPLHAPRISVDREQVFELLGIYDRHGPDAVLEYATARGWWEPLPLDCIGAIVNAAGLALPAAGRKATDRLLGANAVLPLLIRCQQQASGIPRFLHVSSAAVLGRAPLSATSSLHPMTPYGRSKAVGEALLLRTARFGPNDLHIYRPTSVQSPEREEMGRALEILRRVPVLPIASPVGPSTIVTPADVGAAVRARLRNWPAEHISVESSQGDVASYLRRLNPSVRLVRYPRALGDQVFAAASALVGWSPRLVSALRRLEVVTQGQPVADTVAPSSSHLGVTK